MGILRLLTVLTIIISQFLYWDWETTPPYSDFIYGVIFYSILILVILVWLSFEIFKDPETDFDYWSNRWRKTRNLQKISIDVKTEKIIRECNLCGSKNSTFKRRKSFEDWWNNEVFLECSDCKEFIPYEVDEIRNQITKKQVLITIGINIVLIISLLNWFSADRKAQNYDDICGNYTLNKVIDYGLVEPYPKKAFRSDNETNINEQHKIVKDIIRMCEK